MNLRRSVTLGLVGLVALAGVVVVGTALAQRRLHSLDEQGRALVAEGQYLPAVRVLLQAVAQSPGDARAHYYLGLAYAGIGLCGAAWFHLDEAVRLAPAYARPPGAPAPGCGRSRRSHLPQPFDHAVRRDRQQGGALS